jgi:hypothetical protein
MHCGTVCTMYASTVLELELASALFCFFWTYDDGMAWKFDVWLLLGVMSCPAMSMALQLHGHCSQSVIHFINHHGLTN